MDPKFVEHLRNRIPVHRILTSSKRGPGKARQDLIEQVDTEWFAFVDDDVWLRPNWWSEVTALAVPSVGGVEGLWSYYAGDRRQDDYSRAMTRLSRLLGREVWIDRVDRAFTGDTLVRRKAIEGLLVPNIPVYEDEYIRRYVEKNHYKWVRTQNVVCDHLRSYNLRATYDAGRYAYFFGELTPSRQLKRVGVLPVKILFSLAYTGNLGTATFALRKELNTLKGVLHGYIQRRHPPILVPRSTP